MLRAESALWLLIGLFFTLSAAAEGSISVSYQSGSLLHAIPWESADTEQPWAAKARNGGSFSTLVHHITPSWRRFGPATPNDISESIEALSLPLLARHPVTDHLIPILADRWYSDEQAGITYFHIDDDALWSDGIPVTSNDIAYTLQFLTDEKNGTPYQRQQLTQHISAIIIYDPEYFALVH
ncbi:ABC transporter substrate-binding protein, partial [uncultured Thalassolituus sp.]